MKLNFAQRVIVAIAPRTTENAEASQKRNALQVLINKDKVEIDRSCFAKNEDEKLFLKEMKKKHKLSL